MPGYFYLLAIELEPIGENCLWQFEFLPAWPPSHLAKPNVTVAQYNSSPLSPTNKSLGILTSFMNLTIPRLYNYLTRCYFVSMDNQFLLDNWWLVVIFVVWSLVWKGLGLWISARNNDKTWFIALLIINSAGILEIFYIFLFSKRDSKKQLAEPNNNK